MQTFKSLFFLLIFALPAFAQLDGNPANLCRIWSFRTICIAAV